MTSTVANVTVEKDMEEAEPAVVTADDVEGRPAGRITMPIFLNNRNEVASFYFDLTLPSGIVVAEDAVRHGTFLEAERYPADIGDDLVALAERHVVDAGVMAQHSHTTRREYVRR